MKEEFIIIPSCDDFNRGDQALVWETARIIRSVSNQSNINMITYTKNRSQQSEKNGINVISAILDHPSKNLSIKENYNYCLSLKLRWGLLAIRDLFKSMLLLNSTTRKLGELLLSEQKKKTFKLFKKASTFFVKGGGFIHTYGGITALYYMYYSLFHIMLAHSLKKKVIIMPNSYGPFIGLGIKRMVKKTLSKCLLVTSRESISKNFIANELGLNIELYPDLAFSLSKRINNNIKTLDVLNHFQDRRPIAITARPYRFPESSKINILYKSYIDSLRMMTKWLYANGYMPFFVEHTISDTIHESDIFCIEEITEGLDKKCYSIISNKSYDCRDLKAIYSNFDYIIGTRFHSVIFSISEFIPAIAITYGGNKGSGIMKDIGLSEYSIPIDKVSFEILKQKFISLVNNDEKIKYILKYYNVYVKRKHTELTNRVQKLIEKNLL